MGKLNDGFTGLNLLAFLTFRFVKNNLHTKRVTLVICQRLMFSKIHDLAMN